jgi:serine protease Do
MKKHIVLYCLLTAFFFHVPVYSHDLPNFTHLIESSSPAVVQIDAVEISAAQDFDLSPRRHIPELFGDHFKESEGAEKTISTGSGFLISSDGYIVTNAHVVNGAEEIIIRLSDRREFEARVIGVDQHSDLALLKIEEKGLPYLLFANIDQLMVGEWVLAIGSPFGLDYSASVGIVSAIGRSLPTDKGDNYVPFIQSDVALNPGNSGGPLLNLEGKVIGVNSLIFSRSGGSIGLSFAVPANVANRVVSQLRSKGYVDRGWFGVFVQDVDESMVKSLGLKKPVGALIAQVEPQSPAENAGLQPGDVILNLAGKDIVESADLAQVVGLIAPGKSIPAVIQHQGKRNTIDVVIGVLPKAELSITALVNPDRLGLIVSEIEDNGLGEWRTGVLVDKVVPGSAADKAGLMMGDVIMQLGYNSIDNPSDYYAAVEGLLMDETVAVRLVRDGRSIFKSLLLQN